jgi:hypothetical protein
MQIQKKVGRAFAPPAFFMCLHIYLYSYTIFKHNHNHFKATYNHELHRGLLHKYAIYDSFPYKQMQGGSKLCRFFLKKRTIRLKPKR